MQASNNDAACHVVLYAGKHLRKNHPALYCPYLLPFAPSCLGSSPPSCYSAIHRQALILLHRHTASLLRTGCPPTSLLVAAFARASLTMVATQRERRKPLLPRCPNELVKQPSLAPPILEPIVPHPVATVGPAHPSASPRAGRAATYLATVGAQTALAPPWTPCSRLPA